MTDDTSYDFVNDERLRCLPLALRRRMVAVQQSRIDSGFTSKNGLTYSSMERKLRADARYDARK